MAGKRTGRDLAFLLGGVVAGAAGTYYVDNSLRPHPMLTINGSASISATKAQVLTFQATGMTPSGPIQAACVVFVAQNSPSTMNIFGGGGLLTGFIDGSGVGTVMAALNSNSVAPLLLIGQSYYFTMLDTPSSTFSNFVRVTITG